MSPLKPGEIRLLAQTLHHLEGARLQGVISSQKDLILEFWLKGELYFLWYEDNALRPYISFWPYRLPFNIKKHQQPISLFLKAHFLGKHIQTVSFHPEYGRMFRLYFEDGASIEFRLFPHGQNLIATWGEKKVSLHKPKLLQPLSSELQQDEALRSVEEFSNEWLQFHTFKNKTTPSKAKAELDPGRELEKRKKKLKKAIDQVGEELKKKETSLWNDVGIWLNLHQSFKDLPTEYAPFVDKRRSVSWNVNHVFQKAKDIKRKISGTEERLKHLEEQLKSLEEHGVQALKKELSPQKPMRRGAKKDLPKARSLQVADDLKVMAGKNAQDNLKLLRQAKPWDLWFHLKDWPSSHAVVFRPKNRAVTPQEENQIIQWFFMQNFGQKWTQEQGNKYEVIVAECRFVKPIRGDRLGRVNYHNEKVLRVEVRGNP